MIRWTFLTGALFYYAWHSGRSYGWAEARYVVFQ